MGHTNSTTNYGLPQFLTSDKPAWLTDINNAFADIDSGLHTAQSDATTAGTNASQALLDASAASSAASAADAKGAGACASIEAAFDSTAVYAVGAKVMYNSLLYRCNVAVTTPGPWTGSANWERITVNSTIPVTAGNLPLGSDFTDPASTATAINTLSGKVSNKVSQVKFENTPVTISATSGYFEFTSVLNYPTANSILIGCDIKTSSLYATSGTVIQCCYAANGVKPCFQYQRGANAFSNINYDFVFTFYEP